MSGDLDAYLSGLVRLAGLPQEREQALAHAARTGEDTLTAAVNAQQRNRDALDQSSRLLVTAQDQLRRLEVRVGIVEASPQDRQPANLADLPRYLNDLVRDLESVAKAQDWVDRTRAELTRSLSAVPTVPPATAPSATDDTLVMGRVGTPAPRRGRVKPVVLSLVIAVVVLLVLVLVLVNR